MGTKSMLSRVAVAVFAIAAFSLTPGIANAAPTAEVVQVQRVNMNPSDATTSLDIREQVAAEGLAYDGFSTQAVPAPNIKCTQTNASVRTCNLAVSGAYCGSSRMVGVGITTKLAGGIVTAPTNRGIQWSASSTAQNRMVAVGGTFSSVITLKGKSSDVPYVTCSL